MMMMLPAKYSCSLFLVQIIIVFTFMVTQIPCAPPPYNEPLIYLTLTRWENRTISPRLFYVMLVRQQQSNLNQVHQEPYPFETPMIAPHKSDGNPFEPFFSVRNSFHKLVNEQSSSSPSDGSSTTQNILETQYVLVRTNETDEFLKLNESLEDGARITFEVTDETPETHYGHVYEKELIIFKDNTLSNRRTVAGNQKFHYHQDSQAQRRSCAQHYGKSPRAEAPSLSNDSTEQENIPMLDLALKIVKSSSITLTNLVFSPFSIANILALLLLGAPKSSSTFQELSRLLTVDRRDQNPDEHLEQMNNVDTKVHDKFNDLLSTLKYCSHPQVILESANEIFTDTNFTLLDSFKAAAFKYYDATTKQFDFQNDAETFQHYVNSWVYNKTKGKIQSIIDSPPSPLTTLALVNAIYFQGSWDIPFSPQITREGIFHVDEKINVTVKMMTNEMTIPYHKTDTYQMIRLAYKGKDTALYIILPIKKGLHSLLKLEADLTTAELDRCMQIMARSEPRMVTVKIPKMRVESDGNLKDILSNLGVNSIFNATTANFSRISTTSGLHVSSVLHRAIVDINEKGTEAAAVTLATSDRNLEEIPIFLATRPFLFFIHNNIADTILFYGRVVRPQPLDDASSSFT